MQIDSTDALRRVFPSALTLRLAANALHRSDSALGAFLRRKKAQLGAPKAITATAHKLARLIYTMLRYGQEYVDAGAEYYERQYQGRALRAAKRQAAQLGYQLVPMPNQCPILRNTPRTHLLARQLLLDDTSYWIAEPQNRIYGKSRPLCTTD